MFEIAPDRCFASFDRGFNSGSEWRDPLRQLFAGLARPALRISLPISPLVESGICLIYALMVAMPAVQIARANAQHRLHLGQRIRERLQWGRQQDHVAYAREKRRS